MKTFTNCAEKKAKQFLNLLQGYTKGIRMTAILVILLMGVSNAWGASPIYSIGDVYVTGSMNDWKTNLSDWKLGSGNHCTKTFYLEESETNYTFKLYLKSRYYTVNGYWFTKTTSGPANSLSTSGDNMQIQTKDIDAASGYVKLDFDFWGEYSGDSKLSVTQSAVAALSPSLSASSTSLIAGGTSTLTASCSGGSGGYTYSYKVTCDENDVTNSTLNTTSGSSVKFTAPSAVTGKKTYTITVTAKDSHALLSGLATKTATKTITVEEAHNVTVSYKYGSTTIKDNTTTSNVKYETASSITAPAIDGYKFANWTLGTGISSTNANTANPIKITTKSSGTYTLTANYTEDLTSTWHIVGEPTSIFHGAAAWNAHNDNMLKKTTGASTASKGSLTIDVKTLPASNDSYQFKVLNTTGTIWYGWSKGDNHYWMNKTQTTSVYTGSDNGNNLYFIPNALGEYKFDVDWSSSNPSLKVTFPTAYTVTFNKGTGGSSVTATYNSTSFNSGTKVQSGKTVTFTQSASAGYTFKEWNTKSDGTGTQLSTNATYTLTVAATSTVYAIYTKNPDNIVYLKPSHSWKSNNAQFAVKYGGTNHMMTEAEECCEEKYYKVTIPSQYSKFNFVRLSDNGTTEWNVTGEISVPTDGKNLYDMTKIYLKPNANWKSDGARFAAYFFVNGHTDSKKKWMSMLPTDEDGVFYCDFPTDHIFDRVSLTRMNGAESYNDWAYRLNQTKDIELFQGYNSYELEEGKWGKDNSNPQKDDEMNVIYKCKWTTYNPTYSVTLEPTPYGHYTVEYNGRIYKSATDKNVVIEDVALGATIRVSKGTPDNSAEYTDDMLLQKASGYGNTIELKGQEYYDHTICGTTTIAENFITKNPHTVYLRVPTTVEAAWNDDDQGLSLGGNCVYYTHILDGGIGLMQDVTETINGEDGYSYYQFTIPAGYRTFCFQRKSASEPTQWKERNYTANFTHALPFINGLNCFTILSSNDDEYYYGEWGTLLQNGDYRILYIEQQVAHGTGADDWKTVIDTTYQHSSDIIKKGDGATIVSLHIKYDKTKHPEVILQKFTGGKWVDVEGQAHMVLGPLTASADMAMLPGRRNTEGDVNLRYGDGIEKIKDDAEENGKLAGRVWNFVVQQSNASAYINFNTNAFAPYEGQYYIRTDNAAGGWMTYTLPGNEMTYSKYSLDHSGYSHYFCKWVTLDGTPNVKFVVANQYGAAISDTIASDIYTDENDTLKADANVRWMWNEYTNIGSRAYIAGSSQANFLVAKYVSTESQDKTGNFKDMGEWVYEADLTNVQIDDKLTSIAATYDSKEQQLLEKTHFDAGGLIMLASAGNDDDDDANESSYTVRIVYDFKINQTICYLIPTGAAVTTSIDVLIERTNQDEEGNATQVTAAITPANAEGLTVYGLITLTKDHITDPNKSEQETLTYWISFPFDVKIGDITGFGEVGKHWMIKYYDGAERAEKGWFLDTKTFWKFFLDTEDVMKANRGYVLTLNKSLLNASNPVYDNTETLRLYFPSMNKITTEINSGYRQDTVHITEHWCNITSPANRKTKDSHWNMIGVPSFANQEITTTNETVKYFYDYSHKNDTYQTAQNIGAKTFKPMHAYMVQFAGVIDWKSQKFDEAQQQLAAKKNADAEEQYTLRLELQQNGTKADQTFVELHDDATTMFDMNVDLTKMFNASSANIYTLIGSDNQVAANVMPIANTVIPVGVQIAKAGEYTFAMPDGTDGITVELIDYETNIRTNLMLDEYTVDLAAGTNEARFALHVKPSNVTTSIDPVLGENGQVRKILMNGQLYLLKDGQLYDAQGRCVQ